MGQLVAISGHTNSEGGNFYSHVTKQRNKENQITSGPRRINITKDAGPYWLSKAGESSLKPYTHRQQKKTQ